MTQQIWFTVLTKVAGYAYDPIQRHISYPFKCESNVNNLEEGVEAMKSEQERLQHLVDNARNNGKLIETDVEAWLVKVRRIIIESNELVLAVERAKMKCCFGFCPNLKTLYQVSRKAEEKAEELEKLQEKRHRFSTISYDAPLQCMEALSVRDYEALESMMTISEHIINVLTTVDVSMVGVYGFGGVGKTTLAKEVLRQAIEQKLFEKVVMAIVTLDVKVKDIQAQIGEALELNFDGVESVKVRASRLFCHLAEKKKVLIILDDLWQKLDLGEVGIPSKNQPHGCKILLTSRDLHVLSNAMDCQNNFEVGCLPENEAWDLFQKMTNNSFEQHDLRSIAVEVAKVCAGLPIAIVTIARALKDKSLPEWKDALLKLKNIAPSRGLTMMEKTIYSTIEFSYKNLETDELKSTFLLCSQMGYNATTGDLLKYGTGLGLFSNVSTLEEAQNRVYSLVQRLKELCLLLRGSTNKQLVMHDVVRDVGRWISARDDDVLVVTEENKRKVWSDTDKLKTCTRIWIYVTVDEVAEEMMHCSKLVFAHIDGKDRSFKVPDNLFVGLRRLKALDFTSFSFSSLPSSLGSLENLKTLCFHQSLELEGVSIVGTLKKLEILSFAKSNITHLPIEIGELTKLKLLDLSDCWRLEMIPPNLLSRLSQLEELYMGHSFDRWATEGQDTASLAELKQLVSLTNLEISIEDPRLISEDIFSNKLCRYKIFIGGIQDWNTESETIIILKLKLNANLQIEKALVGLIKKTEDLYLYGLKGVKNFVYDLNKDGFPKLKRLHLHDSPGIQYVADMTEVAPFDAFPTLESLYLEKLISLEKIYQSRVTMPCFFRKLRIVNVKHCDGLTHLFSFLVAQGLSQLKQIIVASCASLEMLVAEGSEVHSNRSEGTNVIEFPQLHYLSLQGLPKLKSFCPNANLNRLSRRRSEILEANIQEDVKTSMPFFNDQILFPNLSMMRLDSIDNIEMLWHGQVPATKNSFQKLTSLEVGKCNSLKFVFSYSLVICLGQLMYLSVSNCEEMEEVILVEEESGEEQQRSKVVLLPKLQYITLSNLPKLKTFCKGYLVNCPLLKNLSIWDCHHLKTFVSQERQEVMLDVKESDQIATLTQPLFDEMVVFPSLEELTLWGMNSIEKIWHNQLAPDSFCKLKNLKIITCEKLADIFPPILLGRFQKLEALDISQCDCVQEIFGVEGSNSAEDMISFRFQLKDLKLQELPKLRHIWSDQDSYRPLFTFPNLRTVQIRSCRILMNVFPHSIAENLFELEKLTVGYGVEEIVARGENGEEAKAHAFVWPKLKKLDIPNPLFLLQKVNCNLEELTLYVRDVTPSQILNDHFPFYRLKILNLIGSLIERPGSVGISFGFLQKLHNLEKLCVENFSFEELFSCDGVVVDTGVLTCLKHLELRLLHNLRHVSEKNNSVLVSPFQNIESLRVEWCVSLMTLAPFSASFQNLTTLVVGYCKGLLNLFTVLTAKNLGQLITFKITGCNMMTEILDKGEEADNDDGDDIIFTKLQCLELVDLTSLTSFCSGNHTFSFPSLKEMIVEKCPKMKVFSSGHISTPKLNEVYLEQYGKDKKRWEGDLNSTIRRLYIEMVGLKLSEFPELKELWRNPVPGKFFGRLWSLVVDDCPFFSSAIPSNLLPCLGNLEKLHVRNCDSLEEVFDSERLNADEDHVELLPKLNELCLSDLPRLLNICNKNAPRVLELKLLKSLAICNCPNLQNIFTPSMTSCLVQLRKVVIRNCEKLEEIVIKEKKGEEERGGATIFPLLDTLILESLPNLINISSGNGIQLEFPSLEKISIEKCPNMKPFVSSLLKGLVPDVVHEAKEHRRGEGDLCIQTASLSAYKVTLPFLKKLRLEWHDSLEEMMHGELKVLQLLNFPNEHTGLPLYFLQRFPSIQKLVLTDARFEEIVAHDEAIDEDQHCKLLANLTSLKLSKLAKLMRLSNEDTLLCSVFQRLETLVVQECGIMEILVPSSLSFQCLTTLEVAECNVLVYLITSTAAGSLVQLKRLVVRKCGTIEQIVLNEENLLNQAGKTVPFSRLEELELDCLPSLMGFSLWNCAFIFPSLVRVFVSECPVMKIFSQGVVRTPILEEVQLSRGTDESCWEGSLNATIQKLFIQNHKEDPTIWQNSSAPIGIENNTQALMELQITYTEGASDQGTQQHTVASAPSHFSQENFLKCIMTPHNHFMDPAFAQQAIQLLEWKMNADKALPGIRFLAELVADLKQIHTTEEPLISIGANPSTVVNEHKETLDKYKEEVDDVKEKIQEYDKALADLEKHKLLQSRNYFVEQMKKKNRLESDLWAVRNFF